MDWGWATWAIAGVGLLLAAIAARAVRRARMRKKAADAAYEAMRLLVVECEAKFGGGLFDQKPLPIAVWLNPYLIGWITTLASAAIQDASGGRASHQESFLVSSLVFKELFGIDFEEFRAGARFALSASYTKQLHEDGMHNAVMISAISNGAPEVQSWPIVEEAMGEATKMMDVELTPDHPGYAAAKVRSDGAKIEFSPVLPTTSQASMAASILMERLFTFQVVTMAREYEKLNDTPHPLGLEYDLARVCPPLFKEGPPMGGAWNPRWDIEQSEVDA